MMIYMMQLNGIRFLGPEETAVITGAGPSLGAAKTTERLAFADFGQPVDRDLAIDTFQPSLIDLLHRALRYKVTLFLAYTAF